MRPRRYPMRPITPTYTVRNWRMLRDSLPYDTGRGFVQYTPGAVWFEVEGTCRPGFGWTGDRFRHELPDGTVMVMIVTELRASGASAVMGLAWTFKATSTGGPVSTGVNNH